MRRKASFVLIFLTWCQLSIGLVYADGMVLPEMLSPGYLGVRYHRVNVTIEDNKAVTRVAQEFYNPYSFTVTGQYLFPVPPDAILTHFQVTLDGVAQTVARQDVEMTNDIFFDAVAQRRDPSLLQYADWETLAFEVTVPAGGSRRMELKYEEVLTRSGGLYRYRYVLSTERYSSQVLDEVSLAVDLHSSLGLAGIYVSSHAVQTERPGPSRALITWEETNVRPSEDFELFFAPNDGGFGGGLLTGQRAEQDHFLFLFEPDAQVGPQDILPQDILFVIDRSGSMSGEKLQQAKSALYYMLDRMKGRDRFAIVGFDDRLSFTASTLQPVYDRSLADARRFVDVLEADGSTDIESALTTGLGIIGASEPRNASRIIVFVTDGLPTAGVADEGSIRGLVNQRNTEIDARIHVFGVGYDVNTHLLDRLAAENGGSVTYVQPGENLEQSLTDFFKRIADPVLTDLEIKFEGMQAFDLYPEMLPDLYRGSSLLVTGRYQAAADTIVVSIKGRIGDREKEYTFRFQLDELAGRNYDFVPRLWATRRLGALLDQIRVSGENLALVGDIRTLGLNYGLVTPYTLSIIEAQSQGPASMANMALYDDPTALNQAWGQTTVQARVQNQVYQQAVQADLANGANVINQAQYSLIQVAGQSVDLAVLQELGRLDAPITLEWIEQNVRVDRTVLFGSDEYFLLADDSVARHFLQSGLDVIFEYRGQVVSIEDPGGLSESEQALESWVNNPTGTWIGWLLDRLMRFFALWARL